MPGVLCLRLRPNGVGVVVPARGLLAVLLPVVFLPSLPADPMEQIRQRIQRHEFLVKLSAAALLCHRTRAMQVDETLELGQLRRRIIAVAITATRSASLCQSVVWSLNINPPHSERNTGGVKGIPEQRCSQQRSFGNDLTRRPRRHQGGRDTLERGPVDQILWTKVIRFADFMAAIGERLSCSFEANQWRKCHNAGTSACVPGVSLAVSVPRARTH